MAHCPTCGAALSGHELTCPVCGAPVAFPSLPPGTPLAGGRYVVGRVLGHGGFGITYEAANPVLGRTVAVKEFFPDGSVRQVTQLVPPTRLGAGGFHEARQRFIEEARTLARFDHPGIVRVFEENGTAYLVMEFLRGETLGKRIERLGHLGEREVQDIAFRVADALSVVHKAGLLHRDIKPDNVFLTDDGRVVLIDFGAARDFVQGQTVAHTRMVTPGYAPLEQYATSAKLGPYTDLYALGATLYHALTGALPPTATDRAGGVPLPPLPRNVSPRLARLINRSLGMRVADRPGSVEELLRELNRPAAAPSPSLPDLPDPPPPPDPPAFPARPRRRPRPQGGSMAQGCGCGCLTYFGVLFLAFAAGVSPDTAFWVALIAGLFVLYSAARAR